MWMPAFRGNMISGLIVFAGFVVGWLLDWGITDAEAKGTDGLLKLTGRPTNPQGDHSAGEVVRLIELMAERGYLQLAPGISVDPVKVPNEAEAT